MPNQIACEIGHIANSKDIRVSFLLTWIAARDDSLRANIQNMAVPLNPRSAVRMMAASDRHAKTKRCASRETSEADGKNQFGDAGRTNVGDAI